MNKMTKATSFIISCTDIVNISCRNINGLYNTKKADSNSMEMFIEEETKCCMMIYTFPTPVKSLHLQGHVEHDTRL